MTETKKFITHTESGINNKDTINISKNVFVLHLAVLSEWEKFWGLFVNWINGIVANGTDNR